MTIEELKKKFQNKGEKISKARKVRSLLQKQKALLKAKRTLTSFEEPVLDLHRRNGKIDTYEKATAGKFVFEHSNGQTRYIELRPSDQEIRDYGDRKIRWYSAHEDRPFAGWENPVVDGETVQLGYEKTKATDLKYQQALERLKQGSMKTIGMVVIFVGLGIAIIAFAYSTWIQPAMTAKKVAEQAVRATPPIAGMGLCFFKKLFTKKGGCEGE